MRDLADKQLSAGLLGGPSDWLVKGDLNFLWARWCADSIIDPQRYLRSGTFPIFFADVRRGVDSFDLRLPRDEVDTLAAELARVLWRRIELARRSRRRPLSQGERQDLWDLAGPAPRCWMCGFRFPAAARNRFLRTDGDRDVVLPEFVDVPRPRGLRGRDVLVEVDHVVAVAAGGGADSNLRLACGWCNAAKSSHSLLYDVSGQLRVVGLPSGRRVSLPQPFWVARLLAVRGRCEYSGGCTARTTNTELSVAPINSLGAPTPTNLWVCCGNHDPLSIHDRLIPRAAMLAARASSSGGAVPTPA